MSSDADGAFGACPVLSTRSDVILLGHGSGGRLGAKLVEETLLPALASPELSALDDSAVFESPEGRLAFTTDSFVVTPIFFPGGDIGELAVNGTVNDLAMAGARPLFLSLAFILEEGLEIEALERVLGSVQRATAAAHVRIATGDTKVVGRGSADRLYVNTSGIGVVPHGVDVSARRVRPGDAVILSGTIGDHGVAIMSKREGLEFDGDLRSDTQPLADLVRTVLEAASNRVHALRDPTRGGVAATLTEIATRTRVGMEIDERAIPVSDTVRGACELLGLDPLHVANEGKLVAFVPEASSDVVLDAMQAHPAGREARRIGRVTGEHPGVVVMKTPIGGDRILDLPFGEMLPRIC